MKDLKDLIILELTARNIMGIKAVKICPVTNDVIIEGANSAGKSSVLGAIDIILRGGRYMPDQPLRVGATEGELNTTLGNIDGTPRIIIERKLNSEGKLQKIIVKKPDGEKFGKPQELLDSLSEGAISHDISEFISQSADEQVNTLKKALNLNFNEIDAKIETSKEERLDLFQKKKGAQHSLQKYDGVVKVTLPNIEEITKQKREAEEFNETKLDLNDDVFDCEQNLKDCTQKGKEIASDIERKESVIEAKKNHIFSIQKQIEILKDQLSVEKAENGKMIAEKFDLAEEKERATKNYTSSLDVLNAAKEKLEDFEEIDTSELDDKINRHSELSAQNERYKMKVEVEKEIELYTAQWNEKEADIEKLRLERRKIIASKDLPIKGLDINEYGVLSLNGVGIKQVNSAKQIELSMLMAMMLKPKLKVLRICNASLFDEKGLDIIKKTAVEHGFQIWLESVKSEKTGEDSFFIEDGTIQ